MTTTSTRTVTQAVCLAAFCLGLGGHVAAIQETSENQESQDAPEAEATFDTVVFRVPIEGMVDHGMAPFVARVFDEASEVEGAVVLLDVDTFGGRVDAAVLIRDVILEAEMRSICFIHPRARFPRGR